MSNDKRSFTQPRGAHIGLTTLDKAAIMAVVSSKACWPSLISEMFNVSTMVATQYIQRANEGYKAKSLL